MKDFGQKEGPKRHLTMCTSEPESGRPESQDDVYLRAAGWPPAGGRDFLFIFPR